MEPPTCPICYVTEKVNQIPLKRLIVVVLISMVATVSLMLPMGTINTTLTSVDPGYDIIDFEVAFTKEKAGDILKTWSDLEEEALKSLYIDFAYLVSYAVFLSSLTLLVTRALGGTLQKVGKFTARLPWVAAILDTLENICLIHVIKSAVISQSVVVLAGSCAVVKFVLVGIVAVVIVAAGVYVLIVRLKK
jgi:hypothetical protein